MDGETLHSVPEASWHYTGWVITTIAGVLAKSARSAATLRQSRSSAAIEWIAKFAPYVAIAGMFYGFHFLHLGGGGVQQSYPSQPYQFQTRSRDGEQSRYPAGVRRRTIRSQQHAAVSSPSTISAVGACIECACRYKDGFPGGVILQQIRYWPSIRRSPTGAKKPVIESDVIGFAMTAMVTWFLAWRVDVNESRCTTLQESLVRCYLGAQPES
jgi:hypothetical protein